ncbi:MAG TPA: CBS domain-containing protein [Acidobacteriaceae bacterium]|nr:CBS domain-containing protein [Acidobacteriaceae bacterium]
MGQTLQSAFQDGELKLEKALVLTPEDSVFDALANCRALPILVRGPREEELVGIATPFDLL